MIRSEHITELNVLCPGARTFVEGGITYIYLPNLKLPAGYQPPEVDALLRPGTGPDGYTSRLFLSAAFPHKGQNWTIHHILGRTWHTFSFNSVPGDLRPIEILANHLRVLQ